MKIVPLGDKKIGASQPVFIIAEIGINHNGSLETAKRLIEAAVEAGTDCAKFQMRHLSSLYKNGGNADDPRENLSSQYTLDLLERFELAPSEMFKAFDYCKSLGIMPLCTPWDLASLEKLRTYGVNAYKVSSADMTNHTLLRALAKTGKPLICSTGMSSEEEIKETVALLKKLKVQYVLLHCNSTYPAPFKDINLRYLPHLQKIGDCPVGYSGHERGSHVALAAVALGASVIEKHITLDKTQEGNDHKVSLLPSEFRQMVLNIRQLEEALGTKAPRKITQGERMNRTNLAKSLVAARDLKVGEQIKASVIRVKSPGRGLQPNRIDELTGQYAKHDFKKGDYFFPTDLEEKKARPRRFFFHRPWGIPVRYHDFKPLLAQTNPDFLEFHLSYKDIEEDIQQYFKKEYDLGLVIHSPDIFTGGHLLNLASTSEDHRKRSIQELQKVVNITKSLKPYFKRAEKPLIIASLGGFSEEDFCDPDERAEMYAKVSDSLAQINQEGVEIVAQTLPPFPWYFGGQYYLNLFVNPNDTADFCSHHGVRLCLDTSHSKLACNHFGWSFTKFVDIVGSHVAHLHIADAAGVDEEGLQVGDGNIDFLFLANQLEKVAPKASFIPEIWQGHENRGEACWVALERLRKFF